MALAPGTRAARVLPLAWLALPLAVLAGPARAAVVVHDAAEVTDRWITPSPEGPILTFAGRLWLLIDDVSDPAVSTLGDGRFHPMSPSEVDAALRSLGRIAERLDASALILPYPRRDRLKSSSEGDVIYLSPGIREVSAAHVRSTVVHEVGHLVQRRLAPEGSGEWEEYLDLRGLRDPRFSETAAHRDRPREIFAEDFRILFGDALSRGPHENADLPPPEVVPGLRAWFERLTSRISWPLRDADAPATFPNPFAITGTGDLAIRFGAPGPPGPATADVFDVAGRRVRLLHASDAAPEGPRVFRWDGRDSRGERVGSGLYLVRWRENPAAGTARVQILR